VFNQVEKHHHQGQKQRKFQRIKEHEEAVFNPSLSMTLPETSCKGLEFVRIKKGRLSSIIRKLFSLSEGSAYFRSFAARKHGGTGIISIYKIRPNALACDQRADGITLTSIRFYH
jgi:hypothetical protein